MDFSEKWGTDVETAVELALEDLKLSRDEVDVTVLEEPSRGFFGIGSKLALVRVEKKKTKAKEIKRVEKEKKLENKPEDKKETVALDKKKTDTPKERKETAEMKPKKENHKEMKVQSVIERVPEEELTVCENHVALDFLEEVTKTMGLELDIKGKTGKDVIYIDIQGKDSGTIIGKRGQTLDAIQYLTSLVVNKDRENYTRVVIDAENYRIKREKTLENLAKRLATKVSKSKKSVKLEPMNPYERKVIHAALQNHPKVITRSEGQEPYRRVIIELK